MKGSGIINQENDYDHTINKHTNINDIKHIFDCCEGLSYLVNNAERI